MSSRRIITAILIYLPCLFMDDVVRAELVPVDHDAVHFYCQIAEEESEGDEEAVHIACPVWHRSSGNSVIASVVLLLSAKQKENLSFSFGKGVIDVRQYTARRKSGEDFPQSAAVTSFFYFRFPEFPALCSLTGGCKVFFSHLPVNTVSIISFSSVFRDVFLRSDEHSNYFSAQEVKDVR